MNTDINLILLNIARKVHYADWNWKDVNSPFARLYFVENGYAKILMPEGEFTIKPGYLYFIPPFATHGYENDSVFTLYYIHIYNDQNIFEQLQYPFEIPAKEFDGHLIKRLIEINPNRELKRSNPQIYDNMENLSQNIIKSKKNNYHSIIETKGILMMMFSRFLEKATPKYNIFDKRINYILSYIHENITQNIKIEDLSSKCFLTKDHFIRLFKKEIKCTPGQYINKKKIEKAQMMILSSEKSIKEIAFYLGYNELSYFCLKFKEQTGITPSAYKKQYEMI